MGCVPRRAKTKQGRPPGWQRGAVLYTDELGAQIIKDIKDGNYPAVAADLNGIDRDTLLGWIKRGAQVAQGRIENPTEQELALARFSVLCAKARAGVQGELVRDIRNAAKKDFRAAAWLLERSFRTDWSHVQKVEMSGPDGAPIEYKIVGFDPKGFPESKTAKDDGDGEDEQ